MVERGYSNETIDSWMLVDIVRYWVLLRMDYLWSEVCFEEVCFEEVCGEEIATGLLEDFCVFERYW